MCNKNLNLYNLCILHNTLTFYKYTTSKQRTIIMKIHHIIFITKQTLCHQIYLLTNCNIKFIKKDFKLKMLVLSLYKEILFKNSI